MLHHIMGRTSETACVYDPKKNEVLEFRHDGAVTGEPWSAKGGLDIIEKAVTSGNLH